MRILYLSADLGIPVRGSKGAAVHVRAMAEAFARAGHQVVVATPVLTRSPWQPPADLGVPVMHLPLEGAALDAMAAMKSFAARIGTGEEATGEVRRMLYDEQLGNQLVRRLHRDPPDVIYERLSLLGTAGAATANALDVPLILEVNAPLAFEAAAYRGATLPDIAAAAERWTLARAAAVVVVSAILAEHVQAAGVAADRITVLPNAVDPARFFPGPAASAVRERLDLSTGPVIGFVSGLRAWHGTGMLPAIVSRLSSRHPGLTLVVVGDGPQRAAVEAEVHSLGLGDAVRFTGAVAHDEIPGLIRTFDLALAPYEVTEHAFYFSPLKVFEYLACGVPVVASRVGQLPEIIEDGITGLLCAPGDIDDFVAACDRLLSDPEARRDMGQAGAKLIASSYTWDDNAARVTQLAEGLARNPAS